MVLLSNKGLFITSEYFLKAPSKNPASLRKSLQDAFYLRTLPRLLLMSSLGTILRLLPGDAASHDPLGAALSWKPRMYLTGCSIHKTQRLHGLLRLRRQAKHVAILLVRPTGFHTSQACFACRHGLPMNALPSDKAIADLWRTNALVSRHRLSTAGKSYAAIGKHVKMLSVKILEILVSARLQVQTSMEICFPERPLNEILVFKDTNFPLS